MFSGRYILLRSIEETDIVKVRYWNFDDEISRYFESRFPISLVEQKKWFESQINQSNKQKLIIIDKSTNDSIGMIGIMKIDHVNKNCEVGVTIGERDFWGKAHGKEALKLTLDYLFLQINMQTIYATIIEENIRSINFFKKFGFVQNGLLKDMVYKDGKYQSYVWMSIQKENYQTYLITV